MDYSRNSEKLGLRLTDLSPKDLRLLEKFGKKWLDHMKPHREAIEYSTSLTRRDYETMVY